MKEIWSFIMMTGSFLAFIAAMIPAHNGIYAEAAYFMGLSISLQMAANRADK